MVSILPWDKETIFNSVKKTGRCIIAHEAPLTNGFGAELSAAIQVIALSKYLVRAHLSKDKNTLECLNS